MKLRYVEIDPDIIAELPDWSQAQIEHESETTLKDLGITRQEGGTRESLSVLSRNIERCL